MCVSRANFLGPKITQTLRYKHRRVLSLSNKANNQDTIDEFAQLLAQVPENQRAALLLVHRQGFSIGETAEILNLSSTATQSLLARGRRAIRSADTNMRRESHEH